MKYLFCIFIVISTLLVSSCYYDSEEDLYPSIDCDLTDITYSTAVLPIISTKCYGCHSQAANFGNITLEGHTSLKKYADNGELLGSIKHQSGFSAMPQNLAKLLDCEIEKIDAWVQAGALNN